MCYPDQPARQDAGIRFVQSACIELDSELKQVRCANGESIPFDIASIDSGPVVDLGFACGAREFALPIRPIEGFVAAWPGLLERARQATSGFKLSIVGDGAAGTELAFAIQQRFALEQLVNAQVTLIGNNALPLSGLPERLRNTAVALLKQRGISCLANRRAIEFHPGRVIFSDATSLACASLLVTGAAAPIWPSASGLACDENGFVRVTPTLQSTSHPFVFAAGDVAAYADSRPKSGVFAVRAGPLLADNLRSALTGKTMQRWAPQSKALYLISTGKHHALAAWAGQLHQNANDIVVDPQK